MIDLARIDSINPTLVASVVGENAIAAYLQKEMRSIGLEVAVHEFTAGRPSVVGRLRGSGSGPSLMLNGHTDIVGIDGMSSPFEVTLKGQAIRSRCVRYEKGFSGMSRRSEIAERCRCPERLPVSCAGLLLATYKVHGAVQDIKQSQARDFLIGLQV